MVIKLSKLRRNRSNWQIITGQWGRRSGGGWGRHGLELASLPGPDHNQHHAVTNCSSLTNWCRPGKDAAHLPGNLSCCSTNGHWRAPNTAVDHPSFPSPTPDRCPASPLTTAPSLPGCHLSLTQQQKAGSQTIRNVVTETRQGVQVENLPAPSFRI